MIKDIDIIKRIITMLGYKYRFVPHPEEKCIEIVSLIQCNIDAAEKEKKKYTFDLLLLFIK